eukprot:scaffold17411_cov113-Isochrysis_galbana.AAC.2
MGREWGVSERWRRIHPPDGQPHPACALGVLPWPRAARARRLPYRASRGFWSLAVCAGGQWC